MKNIFIIGCLLLTLNACDSFLEEYSQDLARVETITDLDELLLGSAYYQPAYYYLSMSTLYLAGEPFFPFIHFMSDELKQNEITKGEMLAAWKSTSGISHGNDKSV